MSTMLTQHAQSKPFVFEKYVVTANWKVQHLYFLVEFSTNFVTLKIIPKLFRIFFPNYFLVWELENISEKKWKKNRSAWYWWNIRSNWNQYENSSQHPPSSNSVSCIKTHVLSWIKEHNHEVPGMVEIDSSSSTPQV